MSQMFLALACALLTLLCCHSLLAATVRPYKFGFTIEEQQHRSESRDENGIVMGEFGFITADGIYHVTVYATDENGKFRIISMKNFPYAGPKAPKSPPPTTSTQRTPTPVTKHNFHTVACSGCFLGNSSPETKNNPASAQGNRNTKNEIRPLSQPLSPAAAAVPGEQFIGHTHPQTRTQQTHTQSGVVGQAISENADALQEATVNLAILAEHPDSFSSQLTPGAAPTAATPTDAATTLPPVVANAHTVALSHAIAKVQGMLVTSRPSTSASAPLPQHLLPEIILSSAVEQVQKLARIPPAATGPKDLANFAFGSQPGISQQHRLNENVVKSVKQLVLPIAHKTVERLTKIPPASTEAKDLNSFSLGPQPANKPQQQLLSNKVIEAQRLNENIVTSIKQLVLPIAHKTVERLTKIPPASTEAKDLNSFAFGSQPANKPQQQLLSNKALEAQRLNENVVTSMKQLVLPIAHKTVERLTRIPPVTTEAKDLNSLALGPQPASRQQLPLTKFEAQLPKDNTLQPFVKVELLPRITPATTGFKDIKNFSVGILPSSKQQLPLANAKQGLVKAPGLSGIGLSSLALPGIGKQQLKDNILTPTPLLPNRVSVAAAPSPVQLPILASTSDSLLNTQKITTPAQKTHTVAHTQPLSVKPAQQPISIVGNAAARPAVTATQQQQQPTSKGTLTGGQPKQRPVPVSSSSANLKPNLGATLSQPATGNSANFKPALGGTQTQQRPQPSGGSSASFTPTSAAQPAVTGTNQIQPPSSGAATYTPTANTAPQSTTNKASKSTTSTGATGSADLTGDLYKFKYLLDYNGHEETGSRNGDKVGNYFAIGDDAVERIVEYIANEFGFQPHISWRKLEGKEAALPADNSLKHYEFKWFNKDTE